MALTFKELKQYISRIVPISICFRDGHYDNFTLISDIPEGKYDDLYVYGIGIISVEFPLDVYKRPPVVLMGNMISGRDVCLKCCLEIVLQEQPKGIQRIEEQILRFAELRDYLQIGMNFSVVMKEDWSGERYTWKEDIPEEYDNLYVYGIGIDDVSPKNRKAIQERFSHMNYERIKDMPQAKEMVIVLSKNPRIE